MFSVSPEVHVILTVLAGVIGYLLGSVNSSLVVGKFYGIDVRKHGSGNAGATNTLRTLGKTAALIATIGDMLKAFIACFIGWVIAGQIGIMTAGIAAIIGHNWPLYFKFKGGKGVLTSFAVVIMMDPKIALILFGIFIVIVAITRYVSLGSMVCSSLFPIMALIPPFKREPTFVIYAVVLALMIIIRHRSNFLRIIKGTESKLGAKKK